MHARRILCRIFGFVASILNDIPDIPDIPDSAVQIPLFSSLEMAPSSWIVVVNKRSSSILAPLIWTHYATTTTTTTKRMHRKQREKTRNLSILTRILPKVKQILKAPAVRRRPTRQASTKAWRKSVAVDGLAPTGWRTTGDSLRFISPGASQLEEEENHGGGRYGERAIEEKAVMMTRTTKLTTTTTTAGMATMILTWLVSG